MPLHIVLFEPEIPPNTGNVMRLCHNTGMTLHLVEPLGFRLDDKRLRRAGLDYIKPDSIRRHNDWQDFRKHHPEMRCWAFSTRATRPYHQARFEVDDALLFGPETRGLPDAVLAELGSERCLRLPMRADSRSLNLSNSVAVAAYEGWRQLGFEGAAN